MNSTGIAVYKGYLYAETNNRIVRYALPKTGIAPTGTAQTVLGLPLTRRSSDASLRDRRGGQPLCRPRLGDQNSCQSENRMPSDVPGNKPCTELKTR